MNIYLPDDLSIDVVLNGMLVRYSCYEQTELGSIYPAVVKRVTI